MHIGHRRPRAGSYMHSICSLSSAALNSLHAMHALDEVDISNRQACIWAATLWLQPSSLWSSVSERCAGARGTGVRCPFPAWQLPLGPAQLVRRGEMGGSCSCR